MLAPKSTLLTSTPYCLSMRRNLILFVPNRKGNVRPLQKGAKFKLIQSGVKRAGKRITNNENRIVKVEVCKEMAE